MGADGEHTASNSDKHPTDLAMLRGARLVTSSETEEGRAWAETRIMELTGGDRISARFMRQDFFQFTPEFKLTIIGNHKPILQNVNDAARRRVNAISEMLERDRGVCLRAMRSVPADLTKDGHRRWRLATAVAALERHAGITIQSCNRANTSQSDLNTLYAKFDAEVKIMKAAPTLKERRKIALSVLAPIIHDTQNALLEHGKIIDDEFCQGLVADQTYALALAEVERPCSWSREVTWATMGAAMPSSADDPYAS
jgi:hypothetical protein